MAFLQSLPLDIKIAKTQARIHEWVFHYGLPKVYVSFSGGKDSTVLLDIARGIYPEIKAAFCDTGLEWPEVRAFARSQKDIDIVRPKKNFREVLTSYGYPVVSKEQSKFIYEARHTNSEKTRNIRLNGDKNGGFKISERYKRLLNADFEISDKCCYHLKKAPLAAYGKSTGRVPIIGTLADESRRRRIDYLRNGCNIYEGNRPKCAPLSFWTESDILEYIKTKELEIAPVYGTIRECNGYYYIDQDGEKRTGCVFCAYGVQLEPCPNKFQRMRESHPKLYSYCLEGGGYDENGVWKPNEKGLGFKHVLETVGVPY